jgi:GcrA cell cycle regulator
MWNSGVDINPICHRFGITVSEMNRIAFVLGLRPHLKFIWDDEKDIRLGEMVAKNVSARKIATELGCSKSSVSLRIKKLSFSYPNEWTKERIYLLKEHLSNGLSASEIAKVLGGVTRNAVIGKVHRMGWEFNKSTGPRKQVLKTTKRRPKTVSSPKIIYPEIIDEEKVSDCVKRSEVFQLQPGEEYVSFVDHKDSQCRCIKEKGDKVLGYCANPAEPGSRYCAEHTAIFNRGNPYRAQENEEGQAA